MRKKKLLLIDSSQVLMDVNKRILERAGYTVSCTVGQRGAVALAESLAPDAAIISRNLPDGDGLDLLGRLRARCGIPVMVLSEDREDEVSALRGGANDFLRKPFDFAVLLARMEKMLKSAESADGKQRSGDKNRGSDEREKGETAPQRCHPGSEACAGRGVCAVFQPKD